MPIRNVKSNALSLCIGLIIGIIITISIKNRHNNDNEKTFMQQQQQQQRKRVRKDEEIVEGLEGLVGNTPLMKIKSLSKATGCEILVIIKYYHYPLLLSLLLLKIYLYKIYIFVNGKS